MPLSHQGLQFWEEVLGAPQYIVAPMVDASELAWRMLCRRHGAQLCYTPMLHSSVFVRDPKYRKDALASCVEDRPLIVQFCANDAQVLLEAALLAQPYCDAVDINLGCPQAIARRGRYGAFLQDDWSLLQDMVGTLHKSLSVPVTCKIRVFEDVNHTIKYAQMLEAAGCQMLTVHGRTREQKGPLTGLANWNHIKAVRENVNIPVIANGNIQCLTDVLNCLEHIGCQGVMSAEGILYNPALYEGRSPPSWEVALEYLEMAGKYPCPMSYVRGHLFKIFHCCFTLLENIDLRGELGTASCLAEFRSVVMQLKERYEQYHQGIQTWSTKIADYNLIFPPWICQPYVRMAPEEHLKKLEEKQSKNADYLQKETLTDAEKENEDDISSKKVKNEQVEIIESKNLSKKIMKKLRKLKHNPNKVFHARRIVDKCVDCPNPVGLKCEYHLCKACCRTKCYIENKNCVGHRILIKTKREKARHYAALQQKSHDISDAQDVIHNQESVTGENSTLYLTSDTTITRIEEDLPILVKKAKKENDILFQEKCERTEKR